MKLKIRIQWINENHRHKHFEHVALLTTTKLEDLRKIWEAERTFNELTNVRMHLEVIDND